MHGGKPRPPCYSEDTEILTRDGWKLFRDLKRTEEVATRSEDGVFEWQQPTAYVDYPYAGPMVQFRGRSVDCLVTPDHRMLTTVGPDGWSEANRVRNAKGQFCGHGDGKDGIQREWITPAQRLLERKQAGTGTDDRLVANSVWCGRELHKVVFTTTGQSFAWADAAEPVNAAYGPAIRVDVRDRPVEMTGDQFAAFMGIYLSEGGLVHDSSKYDYKFTVSQTENGKGLAEYESMLQSLFGSVRCGKAGWTIYRKALWRYLHQFGYAKDKFAPPELLEMSRRQLEIFWRYYWLGDGHEERHQSGTVQDVVATSSRRLADDFQEIVQKLGYSTSVRPAGDGCYRLRVRTTAHPEYNADEVGYSGRVYCVTVPNGIVYVRRNGNPIWSGNSPAYQQYLYGVPRSDFQTIIAGSDIDDYGLAGAEVNKFRADVMLYAPLVARRETPYGFPPVERALLPIISGLQKQEYQLDYFVEGTVPAVYVSPGDPNMTPTQIKELQDALNGIAGDPAYHLKVIVLPPGSKVDPQRPVDLSDGFDLLVQTQVAMAFDVTPVELGILPNVGGAGAGGSSNASAVRFAVGRSPRPEDPQVHEAAADVPVRHFQLRPAGHLRPGGHAVRVRGPRR